MKVTVLKGTAMRCRAACAESLTPRGMCAYVGGFCFPRAAGWHKCRQPLRRGAPCGFGPARLRLALLAIANSFFFI